MAFGILSVVGSLDFKATTYQATDLLEYTAEVLEERRYPVVVVGVAVHCAATFA